MTDERPLDRTTPDGTDPRPIAEDAPASTASAPAGEPGAEEAGAPVPPPPPDVVQPSEPPAPTGAPVIEAAPAPASTVPASAANAEPVAAPVTSQPKKKIWPWVLAICIAAGLVLIGGVVACSAFVVNTAVHSIQRDAHSYDRSDLYNHESQDGPWNYYFGNSTTFDDLLDAFNVEAGDPSGIEHARGAYRVGGTDGIAPGLYYLAGTQNGVSNFYVFEGDDDGADTSYDLEASVEYFGNYYAELDEGDCIVYVPQGTDDTFRLASNIPMGATAPYQSGCYRVGIDIPAGTYTITVNADEARTTDSESGAYVMKDLDFDSDSVTESAFVIKGGRQTITVKNGEYLELFAAIASPSDGAAVPQSSERPDLRTFPQGEGGRSYGA